MTVKRYSIGTNPARLVEMTPGYRKDTGAAGLVMGADFDNLEGAFNEAMRRLNLMEREVARQKDLVSDANEHPARVELLDLRHNLECCSSLAERRLERNRDLERQNGRLFRWSCLGYLLALGCLTYIFVTGA